jgi:hypothetical protein
LLENRAKIDIVRTLRLVDGFTRGHYRLGGCGLLCLLIRNWSIAGFRFFSLVLTSFCIYLV